MSSPWEVVFSTKKYGSLCFNHAVEQVNKGEKVDTSIDEYYHDYGSRGCVICTEEYKKSILEEDEDNSEED